MRPRSLIAVPVCPCRQGIRCTRGRIQGTDGKTGPVLLAHLSECAANLGDCPDFCGAPGAGTAAQPWSACESRGGKTGTVPFAAQPDKSASCPICAMSEGFRCPYTPPTPRYYEDLRQLWVGQFLALEFEREAWNQLAVLTAFQLPGWPPVVKSPLRGKIDKKSVAKLKKTLFLLHDRQKTLFVWFHGRKWEQEISWSYTIPLKGT